jgi:hypothetical protein
MQAAYLAHSPSLASRSAEDLLKAWVSGEPARIDAQLERISSLPFEPCDTGEGERRNMLRAVAVRMRECPDLLAPKHQDPVLEVCVRLLSHLVSVN